MEDSTIFFIIAIIVVVIVILVLLFLFRGRQPQQPQQQFQQFQQPQPQPQQPQPQQFQPQTIQPTQCVNNTNCSSGMVCDTTRSLCKMPPGRPCSSDNDCTSTSRCNGGICLANLVPSGNEQEAMTNMNPSAPPNMGVVHFTYVNEYYTLDTSESTVEEPQDTTVATTCDTSVSTQPYPTTTTTDTATETYESETSSYTTTKTNCITDVVVINGTTYKFYTNKMIHATTENDDSRFISSKKQIQCADYWNGTIYAIDENGCLLVLANSVNKLKWEWNKILSIEDSLISISSTYDGKFLLVQTTRYAYLYNKEHELVESFPIKDGIRRRYGTDKKHFVDLDTNKNIARVYLDDKQQTVRDVKDACLDGHNSIRIVKITDNNNRIKYCSGKTLAW